MNLFTKRNRLTDIENKLMVTKGEQWRGEGRGDGHSRQKNLHAQRHEGIWHIQRLPGS